MNEVKFYLNLDSSMMWAKTPKGLKGNKVKYQIGEFNHVVIAGRWYKMHNSDEGLIEVVPVSNQSFDDFDLQVQCEEIYANA